MKKIKIVSILLVLVITSSMFGGCSLKKDERVNKAVNALTEFWTNKYKELKIEDTYTEIKDTRVIELKDNDNELLKDIDCIVEFVLYSNYRNIKSYYEALSYGNTVAIKKDGSVEVCKASLIRQYINTSNKNDLSDIIENITDYDGEYDQILNITKEEKSENENIK